MTKKKAKAKSGKRVLKSAKNSKISISPAPSTTKPEASDDQATAERTEHNKKAMLEALKATLGVVTEACEMTKLSRTQFYQWIKDDPEFKEAVEDLKNVALDFAEGRLFSAMKGTGKGSVTATIFYLKTQGKHRGFVERIEATGPGGGGIPIKVEKDHAAEVLEAALKTIKK